jgi:hypothetical protein
MAAHVTALTGSDQQVITSSQTIYHGFSVRETAGATAVLRVHAGTSNTGEVLDTVSLAANESAREYYEEGLTVRSGIYVDIVSGAVEGSIRHG